MSVLKQERAVIVGLWLWIVVAIFPLLLVDDSNAIETQPLWLRLTQAGVILYIALCVLLLNRRLLQYIFRWGARDCLLVLYVSFGGLVIVLSALNNSVTSLFYSAVYLFVLLFMILFWMSTEHSRHLLFVLSFWSSVLFLVVALGWHGLPENRWIGGIHPNHYGAVAISSVIFARMSGSRIYYLSTPIALMAASIVSSRYAISAILAFIVIDWLLNGHRFQAKLLVVGLSVVFGWMVIEIFGIGMILDNSVIESAIAINSEARGIDSGFTGRAELWKEFLPQFAERPILGYGFRLRENYLGTHNGYLNLLLECGIICGSILLSAICIFIMKLSLRMMFHAGPVAHNMLHKSKVQSGNRYEGVIFSFGVAVLLTGFFQPQLLSFGDISGILFMMFMTSYLVLNTNPRASSDKSTPHIENAIQNHLDSRKI